MHHQHMLSAKRSAIYLCRNLIKPKSMKLHSFISTLHELNTYLEDFPLDTEGQKSVPLSTDKVVGVISHLMSTTWKTR